MKRPIKFEKRFKQPIIFDELQNGLVSPTDIDFCFETDNQFLIIGDCKKDDAPFPIGQKLVLERIADAWNSSGKNKLAVAVISTHSTSPEQPIMLARTVVTKMYSNRKWHNTFITFADFVRKFAEKYDIVKLKNIH